jgi:hypothetical protein
MAFKPLKGANAPTVNRDTEYVAVAPKPGSRKARVALIVDLGEQNRDPLYKESDAPNAKIVDEDTPGAVKIEQKPCHQVAVFLDLTADTVDYGGGIGKAHYRLLMNKAFMGDIKGINFTAVPPMDAKGNRINGKPWGLHPASPLTKLARAAGKPEVIESMDLEELLNAPVMVTVEVKKTEDKNGKEDADGNPIVYTNVVFKGVAQVPNQEDDEGNDLGPLPVPELKTPAKCVTFDNATIEDVKTLRRSIRELIKQANNYEGSQIQKAIEAFEAQQSTSEATSQKEESKPKAESKPVTKASPKKAEKPVEIDDSDAPF